jgi:hypothetical protein
MTTSPRLAYTELTAGQAVPETTVNDSDRILEAFANATHFKSRANNPAQPGSPSDGDCYLLTGTPTGTNWAGQGGKIAIRVNTAWIFKTAKEGFIAWVDDEDALIGYDGASWVTLSTGSGSYQPLDADLTAIAGLTSANNKIPYFTGSGTAGLLTRDTDGALAANSDTSIATQKAVKTYVDAAVTGLLDLKGTTDCSANPNYPAASKGDYYVVTVAGKIGGASGTTVAIGDVYFAIADNAGGTQAGVGTSWDILVHASVAAGGGLLAANNLSDVASASASRSNLGLVIGTNVQAYSAVLANVASSTYDAALKPLEHIQIACSDETTAITTGTAKVTFRMPYAFTVTDVRASVNTAPTGSTILIDINESGTTIISTKLMIDATEKTSTTAATPAVISDASLADDAEMTIDFDQVGSTISGKGVKVILIGHRT